LTTGPVLAAAKPVEVSIPKIGVTSHLEGLGTYPDGSMELPSDPAVAGWYTLGPTPGALGPAVIIGHVTWNREPAVFFRLGALRPGDLVRVARTNGKDAVFAVSRIARFDKTHFPTQAVFGGIDHAGLRLITCGGAYDAGAHRYLDNVVVFASLVGHRP
jgi:sortase (surface protein transpeptidase)